MRVILASKSPRREQLLKEKIKNFEIIVSDYEEKATSDDPVKTAVEFSIGKAKSVYDTLIDKKDVLVIGSDTVVYSDNKILGKAKDDVEAKKMLTNLSGKTHQVISGYCIITNDQIYSGYDLTNVTFNELTKKDIETYVKSGLYKGKAGAYGIQDGYNLVKEYKGSLNNVIGFPTEKIFEILDKII